MELKFDVTFDTETQMFTVETASDNFELEHSGTCYLRIKAKDHYGTVSCYNPNWRFCADGNTISKHLVFDIAEYNKEIL